MQCTFCAASFGYSCGEGCEEPRLELKEARLQKYTGGHLVKSINSLTLFFAHNHTNSFYGATRERRLPVSLVQL